MLVVMHNDIPLRCFRDEDKRIVDAFMKDVEKFNNSEYIHVEQCPFEFDYTKDELKEVK